MTPAGTTETATPRRGRPPRYSRETIVAAVAEMLLTDPTAPFTIARAAEAVGAKPMSLYRHFADRDDLVAAVAQHLFAETKVPLPEGASWQDEVAAWMISVYRMAGRVPQLVQLMASGESAGWLVDSAYLAGVFERNGVRDDRRVTEAVYWVATTTMGHALIYAAGQHHLNVDRHQENLDWLSEEDAARMARLLPHFEALRDTGFERVVEWTIAGLEDRLR
jgi:TetR/AcrR family transcriptional regulator, tetracycline repressor protein